MDGYRKVVSNLLPSPPTAAAGAVAAATAGSMDCPGKDFIFETGPGTLDEPKVRFNRIGVPLKYKELYVHPIVRPDE